MSKLVVPGTGLTLTDGTIVMLARYPGTKWIVHSGWYTYMGQQYQGWYFCSIPAQTVLPVNEEDLRLLTVISGSCDSSCPSGGYPPTPGCPVDPCPPGRPPFPPGRPPLLPHHIMHEIDQAWISVETIAQRNQLNKRLIPNGKVVRVNNVSGVAKYYIWNQVIEEWQEETFGIDTSRFLTSEAADAKYVTRSEVVDEVRSQITEADIPKLVKDEVENSEELKSVVDDIANEIVPNIVNDATADLTERVETVESDVTTIKRELTWKDLPR